MCWEHHTNNCFEYRASQNVQHLTPLQGCWNKGKGIGKFEAPELFLVILADGEFLLLSLIRANSKFECVWSGSQGYQTVTAVALLEKQGRVFYGNTEGEIKELVTGKGDTIT